MKSLEGACGLTVNLAKVHKSVGMFLSVLTFSSFPEPYYSDISSISPKKTKNICLQNATIVLFNVKNKASTKKDLYCSIVLCKLCFEKGIEGLMKLKGKALAEANIYYI